MNRLWKIMQEAKLENSKLLEEAQAGHTEVQHLADELAAAKASLEDQLNSANAARSLCDSICIQLPTLKYAMLSL